MDVSNECRKNEVSCLLHKVFQPTDFVALKPCTFRSDPPSVTILTSSNFVPAEIDWRKTVKSWGDRSSIWPDPPVFSPSLWPDPPAFGPSMWPAPPVVPASKNVQMSSRRFWLDIFFKSWPSLVSGISILQISWREKVQPPRILHPGSDKGFLPCIDPLCQSYQGCSWPLLRRDGLSPGCGTWYTPR